MSHGGGSGGSGGASCGGGSGGSMSWQGPAVTIGSSGEVQRHVLIEPLPSSSGQHPVVQGCSQGCACLCACWRHTVVMVTCYGVGGRCCVLQWWW